MKLLKSFFILSMCLVSCKSSKTNLAFEDEKPYDITIAFGSCNKQNVENILWKEILKNNSDLWIWGGDNIYSDTDNKEKLWKDYQEQSMQTDYKKLQETTKIMGTWDDHDYGLNDGGEEFHFKDESQQLFLDFLGVSKIDKRRKQKGIYASEEIVTEKGIIKIIVLDTRFFRTGLTNAVDKSKRYQPNKYGEGTILGDAQWQWLKEELDSSHANFNLIVSSIQVLSGEHGFETWANFPHEVDRLVALIKNSKAKGVLLLSGDRHISEFSKINVNGLDYPLIDFTSSGLTHTYSGFRKEPNKFREGFVVSHLSFGLLKFDFENSEILMEMRGKNNQIQQKLLQKY
ncbi:alkaline phosphatase D family protein [Litoribaculum gwangyangense]|uniref:PhoD-like phosphatase metallophosphatase domain-containing protein n=1 Tax=Litoribaculum gwangyangense TaxID=1130722 RepID=A0ABP9CRE3_9FLAO